MKTLLRRIIIPYTKSSSSINTNLPRFQNCINTAAESPHTAAALEEEEKTAETITCVCKSFSNNLNWETLNRKLKFIDVRNSAIINKVLIQLQEPPNAKKALSFFHWSSHFGNITHQTRTYALVIHILVNAKLIKDASALIESVLIRSVTGNLKDPDCKGSSSVLSFIHSLMNNYEVTSSTPFVFDLTIQICSKLRMIDEAIDVCFCLGEHGFRLSVISYNTLLHVIQKSDKTKLVWRVYEQMIKHRTYPNEKTTGIMINALCKEGKLQTFVDMIDRIDGKRCLPRVIVNTCLVFTMIEEGKIEDGLVLLKRMLIKNMITDTISYSLIVYAKIKLGQLESAREVFDEMLKRGFKANSFVHTSFIGAYCEAGKVESGDELFKEMECIGLKPYNDTYTHMIVGFSKVGRFEESLNLCQKMVQNGFIPSCLTFNEVVKMVNGHESVHKVDEMLTLLLDKGFLPDVNTYTYLVAGYGRDGDIEGVLKVYYEMEYRKLSPGVLVFTWLIVSLYECGRSEESERYFRTMKARSLVPIDYTYHKLISNLEIENDIN
ncbi:pentatricopeptide repeat-containing protein At1g66345, mitochondrial [Lactuca sativa]|uniref:pentatricopeptide repeat-containing protein At1g66345, mitochondrial n=1 Tax=Lactuca sativa TaxID=4236 RepID=UPI000CB5A76D|nr:pentatricopeptide repeat-containing protein At1g66345, mitochondrial [Lactuca sativa]